MRLLSRPRVVLLGMMSKHPVAGVFWQTLHYLVGFRRLGYDVYYVEAHGGPLSMLTQRQTDDGPANAAALIDGLLRRFDLLLTAETTRYLVTQATPPLDLLQAIDDGMIVLVPLPELTLGGMASAIGTLIFQAFVRAAFARAGSDQTRRDYPLMFGTLYIFTLLGLVMQIVGDITYTLVDPRIDFEARR